MSGDATSFICAACGADMVCSEHGLSLPCDMCEAEGSATSMLCGSCGNTEAREAEFDPLICLACGKVYLHGDADGLCDDPMCGGAQLEPLLGFISYRRTYTSCLNRQEKNEAAVRIKERVEKVLHTQKVQGGFFIDKSGIEREDFAKKISSTIRACKGRVFLLILTPGALDPRDNDDEDWMRNEIHLAIQHGMEIIPVKASNFRKDDDFRFPAKLPEEIRSIQKMNVNLSYIGDLEEHSITDAIRCIANEVKRALDAANTTRPKTVQKVKVEAAVKAEPEKAIRQDSPAQKSTRSSLPPSNSLQQHVGTETYVTLGVFIVAIAAIWGWMVSAPKATIIWLMLGGYLGSWISWLAYSISKGWSWLIRIGGGFVVTLILVEIIFFPLLKTESEATNTKISSTAALREPAPASLSVTAPVAGSVLVMPETVVASDMESTSSVPVSITTETSPAMQQVDQSPVNETSKLIESARQDANICMQRQDYECAEVSLKTILRLSPDDQESLASLQNIKQIKEDAVRQAAINKNTELINAARRDANDCMQRQDYECADVNLKTILRLSPDDQESLASFRNIKQIKEDAARQAAINKNAELINATRREVNICMQQQNYDCAEANLKTILRLSPNDQESVATLQEIKQIRKNIFKGDWNAK